MIAVDTSALMAIVLGELEAGRCIAALEREDEIVISAATVAEALIVARRRNVGDEMLHVIHGLALTVVPLSAASAERVADAYDSWGKGVHPAGLNLGDCFAYVVAKEHLCPLLYVGNDSARTDVANVPP